VSVSPSGAASSEEGKTGATPPASAASPPRQLAQDVDPPFDERIVGRIRQTEVGIALAEDAAGNNQQPVVNGLGHELRRHAPRSLWKGVERASGLNQFQHVREPLVDQVAFLPVLVHVPRDVDIHRDGPGPLDRLRSTHERVLLQLDHRIDHRRRTMHEAEPPAGHGVALGKAVDHNRLIVELGRREEGLVITEGPIDFVRQQCHVPLGRQLG